MKRILVFAAVAVVLAGARWSYSHGYDEAAESFPAAPPESLSILRSSLNRNKGGASFTFVHLSDTHIGQGSADYGTKGYNDAPPIGDVGGPAKSLRAEVNWINAHKNSERIKFVVITGDLTDSAQKSEFLKAREILDTLTVPYVPVLGNHDAWPYAMTSETKYVQPRTPIGDQYFNKIFGPTFKKLETTFPAWTNGTRLTPIRGAGKGNFASYLQNFAFSYRGYRLVGLDFNPRTRARYDINPRAKIHSHPPGIGGEATPHAATISFLKSQMVGGGSPRHLLLFAHHPLSKFPACFIKMGFVPDDYNNIAYLLRNDKGGSVDLWAAGHLHRNDEYDINTLWLRRSTGCRGIETGAAFNGTVRLITVWGAGS